MSLNLEIVAYRDFSDVPRAFLVKYLGKVFFFDCKFEEAIDEYPQEYKVYELTVAALGHLDGNWEVLYADIIARVGNDRVDDIHFDSTSRRAIVLPSILERYSHGAK